MARNRFDERRFARVVCPFDRTESDAVLFERIGAFRFSDQRQQMPLQRGKSQQKRVVSISVLTILSSIWIMEMYR